MQGTESVVKKFCGEKDIMQGAKPCANCNCGLKEKFDAQFGGEDKQNLENGNTESACGKCYLGDAFRCAGCPYRGLPAFEKGDKVKLVNNTTDSTSAIQTSSSVNTLAKVLVNTDDIDF